MNFSYRRQRLAGQGTGAAARGLTALLCFVGATLADEAATVSFSVKDHKFSPAEPTAPAGKPLTVEISNLDSTPVEFESKPLRVEKTIAGGGKITVQVHALAPGRYRFFDDYHETTEGFLVVR